MIKMEGLVRIERFALDEAERAQLLMLKDRCHHIVGVCQTKRECHVLDFWPGGRVVLDRIMERARAYVASTWQMPGVPVDLSLFILIRYPTGAFTSWHRDRRVVEGRQFLNLTTSLILQRPHAGGALEFQLSDGEPESHSPPEGALVLWPGFVVHRVAPVAAGERLSVVTRLSIEIDMEAQARNGWGVPNR